MRLLQQNIGTCNNRENCIPISLFDDATWHVVEVNVAPTANGGAVITFDFDAGAYGGFALASDYTLPEPAYDPLHHRSFAHLFIPAALRSDL